MADWKEYRLDELLEFVIDHRGKTPKKLGFDDFQSAGYPVLSAKHVKTSGLVNMEQIRFANEEMYQKWMKIPVKKGDIILTSEAPLGELFYIDGSQPYLLGQRVFGLRPKIELINPLYLFAWLSSPIGQSALQAKATGSTVQGIKQSELLKIKVSLPSLEYQKFVADILFSINKKIHLNTQTNQTLEAIAQAIFKSWFVDFDPVRAKAQAILDGKTSDEANLSAMAVISGKAIENLSQTEYQELWEIADAFPSEFGDEGLPIGWKFNQADNLFEIGIGKTPPRKETEWFSDNANDMEWISIKDMGNQGMFITESGEYLKAEAVDKFNIKKIPKNTVILSFKLTVGRVSITTKETTTNEAIAHFKIPSPSKLSSEFLYCYLKIFDFNNLGSTSSIATAVNSKMIKEMNVLEPSDLVIKQFNKYIKNIFYKIKENTIQNNNLIKTRDELLPKLLNSELSNEQ